MRRCLWIIVFVALALSEIVLFCQNIVMKNELSLKNESLLLLSAENSAMLPQFRIGLENSGFTLDGNLTLVDSLGSATTLGDFANKTGGNLLVCRLSDSYCWQCNDYAVRTILGGEYDLNNVLFLFDCSQRTLPLHIREFELEGCNVLRCNALGLPAEEESFPYYFSVTLDLQVRGVYFPSKSLVNSDVDKKNLNALYHYTFNTLN